MIPSKFEHHPWIIRQLAVSILGYRNRRARFGSEYQKWRDIVASTKSFDVPARQEWQRSRLLDLIASVGATTPHYRDKLPPHAKLSRLHGLRKVLDAVPLLEKKAIKEDPSRFKNAAVNQDLTTHTSGSTGTPMQFGHDAKSVQRRFAFLHDHLQLAGVDPSDPSVRLSGRILCKVGTRQEKPWLFNPFENQLFLSSYHLDDNHAEVVWRKLNDFRPALLDGYPSGILETLRLLNRHGHRLSSLRAIITTAETLLPELRAELEGLSGVPVMDYYAASEGVPLIQQCPYGTYHVRWQSGIFEVRNGGDVELEGSGELVCTSFVQDRTPLIRYCTGDLVEGLGSAHDACSCGLSTPTVRRVLGRIEDMVYTPDGRALGMFTYRTLKLIDGLGETQVVQKGYGDFEVNSVCQPDADVTSLADAVKRSFERALGYPITLRFNPVDKIPRSANGKVRLVISNVTRVRES